MWNTDHLLHGGDYNPDQWLAYPDVLARDAELMRQTHCNVMSVGIFAWSALEPQSGVYTFDWLDETFDRLHAIDVGVVLATPSGARPAWVSQQYPEVLRVRPDGERNRHGSRHNHCFTSPAYRRLTQNINRKLAERYGSRPNLLLWHVSNEYGGECYCDLCAEAFRDWLKRRYENDLDRLNRAWWATFWSAIYTDWSQIDPPTRHGQGVLNGHVLDWKRFVTAQTIDFMLSEMKPLREVTPNVPVTTNTMGLYEVLDCWRFVEHVDVMSFDSYPNWHSEQDGATGRFDADWRTAQEVAFVFDMYRSYRRSPFLLIESTPSVTNWRLGKLKRPGMHALSSLQAVAHGSDSVMYFQWRKGRGAAEKLHGAVIDHSRRADARVTQDVADVGRLLEKLPGVCGATTDAKVAVMYDWEVRWAVQQCQGPRRDELKDYVGTCINHYRPFWEMGVAADVIESTCDLSPYKLVAAPMLYLLKPGVAEALRAFVERGGTLVATYMTGWVDESDLVILDGWPGRLRDVFGIWAEEIDALHRGETNRVVIPSAFGSLTGSFEASVFCELVHVESDSVKVLGEYADDFYAGRPALTVNTFGDGRAYYITSQNNAAFLRGFYGELASQLNLPRTIAGELPEGVTARSRTAGDAEYVFVMNFSSQPKVVAQGKPDATDAITGEPVTDTLELPGYGLRVLKRPVLT